MSIHLITSTDWNYRHYVISLLKSLKNTFDDISIIAIGPGDWQDFFNLYNVNIIHQPIETNLDYVTFCQTVRLRHLHQLLGSHDYLLMQDADTRQNQKFDLESLPDTSVLGMWRHSHKKEKFKILAASVLFKQDLHTVTTLKEIADLQRLENFENGWDQLILYHKFGKDSQSLPTLWMDHGDTSPYKPNFDPRAVWWHVKNTARKEKTKDWWFTKF
jgi:hypothetical protein